MRSIAFLFFLSCISLASAQEDSPDGRYAVILRKADKRDDIQSACIKDKKTGRTFYTEAHDYEQHDGIDATWRSDSHIVAFNFSPGSRRHETVLYEVDKGKITKLSLPDFVLNILGRQGAVSARFKNFEVTFVKFLPDNQCLLFAHVEPEPIDSATTSIDGTFRPTEKTDFDITLRLNNVEQIDLVEIRPDEGPAKPPEK